MSLHVYPSAAWASRMRFCVDNRQGGLPKFSEKTIREAFSGALLPRFCAFHCDREKLQNRHKDSNQRHGTFNRDRILRWKVSRPRGQRAIRWYFYLWSCTKDERIRGQHASKRFDGTFNCGCVLRIKEFEAKQPVSDSMVLLIVIL